MKILLVCKNKKMEYLGPMYLSAVIKQNGSECKIVSIDKAKQTVDEWKPDITGFSIMSGDEDKYRAIFAHIKDSTKVIVGGPHPSFAPEDCEWADGIFRGEAESAISIMLDGKSYPDIDSFPWPAREDFPGMKIRDFITSRGCIWNCHYCFNEKWNELHKDLPTVRTRSVSDVVNEVKSVSPEFVYFQDSCLGVNMKWMRRFAPEYKSHVGIPYHCHMRPRQITEEMALLLKQSGCASLRIALETGSDRLKELIGRKNTSNEDTVVAANHLRKQGISLMVQNMLGLPSSTIDEDFETLEANIIAQPDYAWSSIFVPYPGTVLGDMCKEKGWYTGDYSDITDCFFDHSVLNVSEEYKEQVYHLQKVFALCVRVKYVPKPEELTAEQFPMLIHKLMRDLGDGILYGGVI